MVAPDARLLVLHRVRVKGFEPARDDDAELVGLAAEGLVQRRDGVVSGWRLTPAGLAEDERLVQQELDGAGVRDRVVDAYRRFLAHNHDFLELCTDAQVSGADVTDRLGALHREVGPIVDDLAGALARFAGYRDRLDRALDRVRTGDVSYLTRPLIDSYHTVWSELHEDLLATLGIARGSEMEWLASAK